MSLPDHTLRLSEFNSQKFRFWSFVAMFLLVFVHGYNLQNRYMQPWTTPEDAMTFTAFTEYFLANGIFRFRIPMLFIISGFLFAMHDYRPYGERTRKRLRTLLLPYLIWSALGFGLTYLLELFPVSREWVANSNVAMIDDTRDLVHDYRWHEILIRWFLAPVPYQLWFIRVLLIYNLAYPAIRWLVMHRIARWPLFSIAFLMWLGTMNFGLIEGEGLLFFSLGILMQKKGFDIDVPKKWLNPVIWGALFITLTTVKTFLAFRGFNMMGQAVYQVMTIMHKMVIFSGLVTAWYGCNALVKWCMSRRWFVWLASFSFMIYAVHAPLIAYLIDPFFSLVDHFQYYRMVTFIVLPLLVITLAVTLGATIRKFAPGFYGILTGGRGF